MSDHTRTKNNTNTAQIHTLLADPLKVQIAEAVSLGGLSSDEVSEMLNTDKKRVSRDLDLLTKSHILVRHLKNGRETYTILSSQLQETIHILYGLWADSIRSHREYAEVKM